MAHKFGKEICELRVSKLTLGRLNTNCYVAWDDETKNAVLFDAPEYPEIILKFLRENGLTLKIIMLTHAHFDHILALRELKERTGAKIYTQSSAREVFTSCVDFCRGLPDTGVVITSDKAEQKFFINSDEILEDGAEITLDSLKIRVIFTPGHSIDSTCFLINNEILISGDTLFCGTIGRTDVPSGDFASEIRSIKEKLFILPDEIKVYPGHGWDTTIGFEKKNNDAALEN
jgi:glyoxylase-like metal-dependent hydrolase (beta-lactamase superfamily II)